VLGLWHGKLPSCFSCWSPVGPLPNLSSNATKDTMDSTTILAGVAILAIFYCVVCYFSSRTWQVAHVLLVLATCTASICFLVLASATLETTAKWRSRCKAEEKTVKELQDQVALVTKGYVQDNLGEFQKAEESVREVEQELRRQNIANGLVWSRCVPSEVTAGGANGIQQITLIVPGKVAPAIKKAGDDAAAADDADADAADDTKDPADAADADAGKDAADADAKAGDADAEAEQPPLPLIQEHPIVYVFREVCYEAGGEVEHAFNHQAHALSGGEETAPAESYWWLPSVYLGAFEIQRSADNKTAILQPIHPLSDEQIAEIQDCLAETQVDKSARATLRLYSIMPADSHEVFAGMDEDALRNLMPEEKGEVGYEEFIQRYACDLTTKIPKSTPTDQIYKRVRFLQNYPPQVDEAGAEQPGVPVNTEKGPVPGTPAYFDEVGRAKQADVWYGKVPLKANGDAAAPPDAGDANAATAEDETVRYFIGSTAFLDSKFADELIAKGVCEEVESIYVRDLRDYAYEFDKIRSRMRWYDDAKIHVIRETRTLVDQRKIDQELVDADNIVKDQLQSDYDHFLAERNMLERYFNALQRQHDRLKQESTRLPQENQKLANELDRLEKGIIRAVRQPVKADSKP